jgi:hypothetical protein
MLSTACSLGLSATSQQYFSLRTNQPPATSQQYFSLRTNQHQPSATSQPNRLPVVAPLAPSKGRRKGRVCCWAADRHTHAGKVDNQEGGLMAATCLRVKKKQGHDDEEE